MKRIFFLTFALLASTSLRAQDAATEERLNKLNGRIEDLIASQENIKAELRNLSKEIDNLREQVGKPTGNYAAQDDVKRLKTAIEEVDRKRIEDYGKVSADLKRIAAMISGGSSGGASGGGGKHNSATTPKDNPTSDPTQPHMEYTIQAKDSLSAIVQAYKEKSIKITVDDILKANPGLKADKLKVGQTIIIPQPKS